MSFIFDQDAEEPEPERPDPSVTEYSWFPSLPTNVGVAVAAFGVLLVLIAISAAVFDIVGVYK